MSSTTEAYMKADKLIKWSDDKYLDVIQPLVNESYSKLDAAGKKAYLHAVQEPVKATIALEKGRFYATQFNWAFRQAATFASDH
jgi:hypothetical protein